MSIRSHLSRYQPNRLEPHELKALKISAWQQPESERALLIGPEDFQRLTPIEKQVAVRIGDRLYGRILNGR